jgi:F0F1-type ATP synthase assembly protein I
MGRFRIKKKEEVIPFRQTMAYRMIMLTLSILLFLYLLYEMVVAWSVNNTLAFLIAGVPACVAAFAIFYNLDHLKTARIPARTLKRIKRR